jgi:hypothetical protein
LRPNDAKARTLVEEIVTDDRCRTTPHLLVAGLRVKGRGNEIAALIAMDIRQRMMSNHLTARRIRYFGGAFTSSQ